MSDLYQFIYKVSMSLKWWMVEIPAGGFVFSPQNCLWCVLMGNFPTLTLSYCRRTYFVCALEELGIFKTLGVNISLNIRNTGTSTFVYLGKEVTVYKIKTSLKLQSNDRCFFMRCKHIRYESLSIKNKCRCGLNPWLLISDT